MTDRMDELLSCIGSEANANVNYDALYGSLLAESKKRAAKRRKTVRLAGAAAAFVALVGISTMALSSTLGAKSEQAPMLAMSAADTTAEEACAEEAMDTASLEAAPAEAAAPKAEEPAAGVTMQGANDAGREGDLSSAFSAEDMFEIGLPREGWQEELHAALPSLDVQLENVENTLEAGFAFVSATGNYAIWNTGNGMFSIMGETGARETMIDELQKICK